MAAQRIDSPIALEGVREVVGEVRGEVPVFPESARSLLSRTRLRCQKGGIVHDAMDCVECDRFINFRPSPDLRTVTIRCQWHRDDPVSDLMTLASAAVQVAPETPVLAADDIAIEHNVRHLIVARGGDLLGIVSRTDLLEPVYRGETVADRMTRQVWAVPPDARLEDVADAMRRHRIGCFPVVDSGVLVGIVSRGDLHKVGVSESRLGERRCAACGSHRDVSRHLSLGDVDYCLECIERALAPTDRFDLGGGD
jgi:CBS-domain-containing membrane protein